MSVKQHEFKRGDFIVYEYIKGEESIRGRILSIEKDKALIELYFPLKGSKTYSKENLEVFIKDIFPIAYN